MHEYLRGPLLFNYRICKLCATRTQFTCVRCGVCYSCHWKDEKSSSQGKFDTFYFLTAREENKKKAAEYIYGSKVVNVLGEETEPICDFLSCHHKFSEHGKNKQVCKCKHPQNKIMGLVQNKQ